jgi:hypothetical protein
MRVYICDLEGARGDVRRPLGGVRQGMHIFFLGGTGVGCGGDYRYCILVPVVKCMAIMICGTVLVGLVCGWHSGGWCSGDSVCDIMVFVASNLAE